MTDRRSGLWDRRRDGEDVDRKYFRPERRKDTATREAWDTIIDDYYSPVHNINPVRLLEEGVRLGLRMGKESQCPKT